MRSVSARPASRGRDEPAFAGDEHLGRREAEHLGVAEPADRAAVGERAERVRGVEDDRDAARPDAMRDHALGVARRAEHVGREQRRGTVELLGRVLDVDLERRRVALDEPGRRGRSTATA